jgi:L-ascorbate metabolism protein UlaG (beta-lactamase superfamily)
LTRLPPAQFVLSTHEHDDHADPIALTQLSMHSACVFVGPAQSVNIARESGFRADRVRQIGVGDRLYDDECKITVAPTRDDTAQSPVGYIVQINDVQIYHGGDAQPSEFFAETGQRARITCCCLSVGGVAGGEQYYLSPEGAIEAANALGAGTLIPLHWDLWTINSVDEAVWTPLKARTEPPAIRLLLPGQHVTLGAV